MCLAIPCKVCELKSDDAAVIDVEIAAHKLELRFDDTYLCTPLGFASYRTVGGLRKVEYRRLAGVSHH